MPIEQQISEDHPLMIAWKAYQETDDFKNTKKWAHDPKHLQGSLWAVFMNGWSNGKQHKVILLQNALEKLMFAAETSGGTAGRDEELCEAIAEAKTILDINKKRKINKEMKSLKYKKYIVFMYHDHYPSGGLGDIAKSFDDLGEASKFLVDQGYSENRYIVDRDTWEIVLELN